MLEGEDGQVRPGRKALMRAVPRAGLLLIAAVALLIMSAQHEGAWAMDAATATGTEVQNKKLVRDSFAAWQAGTGSPFDLLSEAASWTIVGRSAASKTYPTREAFLREVIGPFNARMSKRLTPSIREIYGDGDTVVVFFDASGVARDGLPYFNTYVWLLEMRGGRIQKAHAFFDSIAFDALWNRVRPPQR
jgi:uncharacterized protein